MNIFKKIAMGLGFLTTVFTAAAQQKVNTEAVTAHLRSQGFTVTRIEADSTQLQVEALRRKGSRTAMLAEVYALTPGKTVVGPGDYMGAVAYIRVKGRTVLEIGSLADSGKVTVYEVAPKAPEREEAYRKHVGNHVLADDIVAAAFDHPKKTARQIRRQAK